MTARWSLTLAIASVLALAVDARAETVDWSQYIDKNPTPAAKPVAAKPATKPSTKPSAAPTKPVKVAAKAKPKPRAKPHR